MKVLGLHRRREGASEALGSSANEVQIAASPCPPSGVGSQMLYLLAAGVAE